MSHFVLRNSKGKYLQHVKSGPGVYEKIHGVEGPIETARVFTSAAAAKRTVRADDFAVCEVRIEVMQ